MPEIQVKTKRQKHYWGQVAGFDLIIKDNGLVIVLLSGKKDELLRHQIPLYDRKTIIPIKIRHGQTKDFNNIQIITETAIDTDPDTGVSTEKTFGYCLNIEDSLLSEWGWW